MAITQVKTEKPKTSLWRILSAVFVICVAIGYTFMHTNFVTGRSLLLAFPGWEVTYRSCWPNPFGGAWVSDVTLMPVEGEDEEAFHFDHLTVDIPIYQFYSSGLKRKARDRLEAISDIRLEFSGGHGSMQWPYSNELYFFGTASTSPFEAEGCVEDGSWVSEEFAQMGLEAKPTELSMAWHRQNESLVKEQSIHTPGVGRVDYREEQVMHDEFPLFSLIETDANELVKSEWHIKDEGFVAARNQYCARKDGVSPQEFVTRHVDTVERMLATVGLQAGASTRDAYRRFATQGGTLDLVLNYSPTIDASVYEHDDFDVWLGRTHGELSVDGSSQALSMHTVAMQPFSEDSDELTPFAALQKERGLATTAAPVGTDTQAPASAAAPTIAVATAPPPEPVAKPAPDPVAEKNADWLSTEPTEADPDTITRYADLGKEVGHRLLIYLKDKPPMRAEVIGSEAGVVRVRRQMSTGWVEHTLTPASFERATRMH